MASLTIRIKKKRDGADVLTCTRADGSATWQRMHPVFPIHDLTHYAVETTLGCRDGFFGLVAQGWNIDDFGSPWPRGPLPLEAGWVEAVVGLFWHEYLQRERFGVAAINDHLADAQAGHAEKIDRRLTEDEAQRIRERQRELAAQWERIPAGEALELPFPTEASGS